MPLLLDADHMIRENLLRISRGERPPLIQIGVFTDIQFKAINLARVGFKLHELEANEIVFIGRHLYESRTKDGYVIDDIILQIVSGMCEDAVVVISKTMSCTRNPNARNDGHGNAVNDLAVYEMTVRKPRAELFSVVPKGDHNKPVKK